MENYAWDNWQRVGIDSMDDQHEILLGYIRELHHINEQEIIGEKINSEEISMPLSKVHVTSQA